VTSTPQKGTTFTVILPEESHALMMEQAITSMERT